MEFKTKFNGRRMNGITDAGNEINYPLIKDEDMHKLNPDMTNYEDATVLPLLCSFSPTAKMADFLQASEIVYVEEIDRTDDSAWTIFLMPMRQFTYEEFKNILFNLIKTFNL
ncbi:MAG: hypothetical protein QM654_16415 [Dysgonamonadaceae bacterium]